MSVWGLYAMPADRDTLTAMLAYAYRRGRAAGQRAAGVQPPQRPLTKSCDDHAILRGPDPGCAVCIEASSYCPHGHLLGHPDAPVGAPCWRPRYVTESDNAPA